MPTRPVAAKPTAAPALSGSWLAAQGRLPLAYMALGLGWLVVGTAMLVHRPGLLALPHLAPAVIALTHTWVLGVYVTVATGAIYQLAPVALGTTLWSERAGWVHLALHAIGVPVMIWGFSAGSSGLLAVGGSLVASGILLFALNTSRTVFLSGKRDAVASSLVLAAGWLAATVLAGLVLVANRAMGFWAADALPLLRAHAHLGLAGFFLTLLQGVTFRLVPMFTLGDVPDWRPVKWGLGLSQAGLIGLVPSLALQAGGFATISGSMILGGMAASGWALHRTLATRKKKQLDPGLLAFLRGLAGLFLAAAGGVALVSPSTSGGSAPGGFNAMVYGIALFCGGLLPVIAGMMCKIVPFLTWMRAYGPKVGRVPTPSATALSNARLARIGFALQLAAVVPLVIGAWSLNAGWLRIGSGLLAAGVACFLYDMIGVFRHLRWPVIPAARVSPRTPFV